MKKIAIISVFLFTLICSQAIAGEYKIIKTDSDLNAIYGEAKQILLTNFGIVIRLPIKTQVVTGKKLDEFYHGKYRGAEIGLYRYGASGHEIYIMVDQEKDEALATLIHEMTHAWQTESCPANQDIIVKEGFARWVEYKSLDKIGAYVLANRIKQQADPVYGVGFKKMLEWEDKVGEKQLPIKIRKVLTINDNI